MWLPTPIYERIPQFWFLLGLLFLSSGLYLGFEFALSFWYMAAGFSSCAFGVGTVLLRMNNRQGPQAIANTPATTESVVAEPEHDESAYEVSEQDEPAHAE